MKRYFDIHDKRIVASVEIKKDSPASAAPVEEYKKFFGSNDVRELTLSQYKRLRVQYQSSERQHESD